MNSKREISPTQKKALAAAGALDFLAKLLALRDIKRRPIDEIRGSKRAWRLAMVINFFGPAGYFLFGRRRPV